MILCGLHNALCKYTQYQIMISQSVHCHVLLATPDRNLENVCVLCLSVHLISAIALWKSASHTKMASSPQFPVKWPILLYFLKAWWIRKHTYPSLIVEWAWSGEESTVCVRTTVAPSSVSLDHKHHYNYLGGCHHLTILLPCFSHL